MIVLWILLLLPLCLYEVFRYQRRRMYELASKIPGIPEFPFVGILFRVIGDSQDIMNTLKDICYDAMKNNGISRFWIGPNLYFGMVDPVDVEVVLKVCLEKDDLHRFFRQVLGNGLIFAPVSIWRPRRKNLLPAFNSRVTDEFVEVFSKQGCTLTQQLDSKAGTGTFKAWPFISGYTLDLSYETVTGQIMDAQKDPNIPFLKSMTEGFHLTGQRIFHLWLQSELLFKFTPQHWKLKRAIKILHGVVDEIIKNRRAEIGTQNDNMSKIDHESDILNGKRTFLDLLMTITSRTEPYSDLELREEMLTLMVASTDSSATGISFTLMLLAKYPEVQEKVYQELCDVFGKSTRPVVKEDLSKLVYLDRVMKESLRLFPPVPFIIRKVSKEIKLPSGHVLPAGSGVVVNIWGAHRDPKYWGPEAEHFDPDRFSPDRFNLKHACSYMPFSNGIRNCIGSQFAMMSMKAALAAIVHRYRLLAEPERGPIPNIPIKLEVLIKAVNEFELSLEKRR